MILHGRLFRLPSSGGDGTIGSNHRITETDVGRICIRDAFDDWILVLLASGRLMMSSTIEHHWPQVAVGVQRCTSSSPFSVLFTHSETASKTRFMCMLLPMVYPAHRPPVFDLLLQAFLSHQSSSSPPSSRVQVHSPTS